MTGTPENESDSTRKLIVLFAGLYTVEGLCALSGLTHQPFDHFGKDVAGWSATHLSSMHALMALPWAVKPIYGALSDNVPLLGSRRKSYLLVGNGLAVIACLALWLAASQTGVIACLVMISLGMALSSAVAGGVLVESGQRHGNANLLVTQQWLWYGLSNLGARLGGGYLAGTLPGAGGLHAAGIILVVPLICVIALAWLLTPESPRDAERKDPRTILREMGAIVRSRQLLLVAAFLFLFTYNPGLHTPLYFHLTNDLHFSQDFVGTLAAAAASGSIVGVVLCRALAKRLPLRAMFYVCVVLGVATTLGNLVLFDRPLALAIYFASGISTVFSLVMAATLAAEVCPGGQEGLVFAAMMSIENAASIASDASGSYMFDAFFHKQMAPLIVVSAAFTAFAAIFVWLLPEGSKEQPLPA